MKQPVVMIRDLRVRRNSDFCLIVPCLSLKPSTIIGLVGANGSGKTTLLESVSGLILPDRGQVRIKGLDPFQQPQLAKRHIGFVPDDDGWIIPELTANEYFKLLASLYRKAGVKHDCYKESIKLAKQLLLSSIDQQIGRFSHGNRKKVQLIGAFCHRPDLLIIDELRNGLDPVVIKRAEKLLLEAKTRGATVLVSTHDLYWAERLADQLIIIKEGQVVWESSLRSVMQLFGSLENKFLAVYDS